MRDPMRLSSGSGGMGTCSTGVSAAPSIGQNPASSGNSRWQVGQLFKSGLSGLRLPLRSGGGRSLIVEDARAARALLERVAYYSTSGRLDVEDPAMISTLTAVVRRGFFTTA